MTDIPRPALQLYSVRTLDDSLPDIVRRAAAAGYEGVEFAHRFREEPPEAVATALSETGTVPVGVHAELPLVEAALTGENDLLDRCSTIGCDRLIVPHISFGHLRSRNAVQSLAQRLRDASVELDDYGIDLGIHNVRHYLWPLLPDVVETITDAAPLPPGVENAATMAASRALRAGRQPKATNTGLWNLITQTEAADLFFEVEVGEIRAAGFDPVSAFPMFGDRLELLHLRDVAPTGRFGAFEDAPHGEGVLDMERIFAAARDTGVEWIVYENELDVDADSKIDHGATFLRKHLGQSHDPDVRVADAE